MGAVVPEVLLTAPALPVAVDVEAGPVVLGVPAVDVLVAAPLYVPVSVVGVPEVAPAVVVPPVVVPAVEVSVVGVATVPLLSPPIALILAAADVLLASVWRSLAIPLRKVCDAGA